ncbi:IclR family transcriptional regulator [Streptomyces sp. NBC_01361]|uniref:IclR family transcriptional regulator n=1 Tax=Streptomyces sp. NBC_01361 TaxID=2903838 RepID=UPI002E360075|nr:IclR family transcriptional regulator [Streptomyces sp. NBC_01361]
MAGAEEGTVRSVLRAVDLLNLHDDEHESRAMRELIESSGLAKTTVVRLVRTLEECGLLWHRRDGRTVPGPALLRWAVLAQAVWQLPPEADDALEALSDTSGGEAVHLYVRQQQARLCIARHEGTRTLRHVVRVGEAVPLWSGAASHVLLSQADAADIEAVAALAPHGAGEHTLMNRVRRAAARGWSVSRGEQESGVCGVAAPVFDSSQSVVAALALEGRTVGFTDGAVPPFVPALLDAARTLTILNCIEGAAR